MVGPMDGADAGDAVTMARETKVGLLAGLAFIICFAVILSHRGRADGLLNLRDVATQLGVGGEAPPAISHLQTGSLSGTQPRQAVDALTLGPAAQPTAPVNLPPIVKYDRGQGAWITPEQAALQSMTSPVSALGTSADAQRALEEHLAKISSSQRPPSAAPPASDQAHAAAPITVSAASPAAVEPGARRPADGAEYLVRPGDTLSKIAEAKYGTRSRRIVDAIMDANRGRLSDPNQVQSGMTLMLPKLEPAPGPARVERTAHVEPTNSKNPAIDRKPLPSFRWYQVRKNDRYAAIARLQLGDDTRWREIFELNKDKFPDANQIREGVRIKIPVN